MTKASLNLKIDLRFKQYFPYNYFSTKKQCLDKTIIDILKEDVLPIEIDEWDNLLTKEKMKKENIMHAQSVFLKYGCKNLDDYMKLYLKVDVLLLADTFEKFVDTCLKRYNLDPSWY